MLSYSTRDHSIGVLAINSSAIVVLGVTVVSHQPLQHFDGRDIAVISNSRAPSGLEPGTGLGHFISHGEFAYQRSWQTVSGDQTVSIYGDHDSKLYERIVATVNAATYNLE
jgi:hypothetical protein